MFDSRFVSVHTNNHHTDFMLEQTSLKKKLKKIKPCISIV